MYMWLFLSLSLSLSLSVCLSFSLSGTVSVITWKCIFRAKLETIFLFRTTEHLKLSTSSLLPGDIHIFLYFIKRKKVKENSLHALNFPVHPKKKMFCFIGSPLQNVHTNFGIRKKKVSLNVRVVFFFSFCDSMFSFAKGGL